MPKQFVWFLVVLALVAAGLYLRSSQRVISGPTPPPVGTNEVTWSKIRIEGVQTEYDFGLKTNVILFFDGRFQTTNANRRSPTMYEQRDAVPCVPIGANFTVGKLPGESQYLVLYKKGVRMIVWKYDWEVEEQEKKALIWHWWSGFDDPPGPIMDCPSV